MTQSPKDTVEKFNHAPQGGWRTCAEHSLHRIFCVFAPGGKHKTGSFYTRDWAHSKSKVRNELIGFFHAEKWAKEKKIPLVLIFTNDHANECVRRYERGVRVALKGTENKLMHWSQTDAEIQALIDEMYA